MAVRKVADAIYLNETGYELVNVPDFIFKVINSHAPKESTLSRANTEE